MTEDRIVRIEQMTHRFDELVAVDAVSFHVERGETFGLIGPDGAGKTTTLRAVLGLLRPTDGQVLTFGQDPGRFRRQLSKRVGYLSQRFSIYGDLSIEENVAFFARAHEMRDWKPRREELLERLDLARFRKRLADRLSGGMKQKLALACTLIHTPELLTL
ncbi:MAG: ABC transporter ATP-binding protein, partial [Candidatus Eisenbacteria bacterium]|nr:ABC transporter ATP-binding protein [Candidatus Eisenbacteria bacterium]